MSDNEAVIQSSGNVYADLGFEAPAIELAKAELARAISRIIELKGWTQEEAARQMEIDQPKVSSIVRGRLTGFSVERLLRVLNQLDYTIDVTVSPAAGDATVGIDVKLVDLVSR